MPKGDSEQTSRSSFIRKSGSGHQPPINIRPSCWILDKGDDQQEQLLLQLQLQQHLLMQFLLLLMLCLVRGEGRQGGMGRLPMLCLARGVGRQGGMGSSYCCASRSSSIC